MSKELQKISDEEILRLWHDKDFKGSFRGVKTFQILLKTDLNIDVPENRLYKVLKTDSVYLLHAKPKRKFDRRKFDINYYGELVQCDLAYIFQFENYKYFLLVIDAFSSKIFTYPLKDKTAVETLKAFQIILQKFKFDSITKLEADQGTEFSLVKEYCKKHKIVFKYKYGKNKARFRLSIFSKKIRARLVYMYIKRNKSNTLGRNF